MASTCHLLQRATLVEIAAPTEPGNLAMQLAPVLDPESGRLATCRRHRSSLAYLLEGKLWFGEMRLRTEEKKDLFSLPAAPSLPQPSVSPAQITAWGQAHTRKNKPVTFTRVEQLNLTVS